MRNKLSAWLIGIGILLLAIHNPNQPLINYTFLPSVGIILAMFGLYLCLINKNNKITLGSKYIWIPLLVIVTSIILSIVWQLVGGDIAVMKGLSYIVFAVSLFGFYLVSRILGEAIFKPFTYIVILESISTVLYGLTHHWVKNGGIASPTNYDMAAGLLIFGVVVGAYKHRWWLSAVALIGLFFTGADEAIFACAVMFIVVLIRRDWSKKLLLPVGVIVIALILCTTFGITQKLYYPTAEKIALAKEAVQDTPVATIIEATVPDFILKPITEKLDSIAKINIAVNVDTATQSEILDVATGYRWATHWRISPIKPFGYGYNINEFYVGIPHNIVLIIIEQVGILAAIAWLFVVGYCLVKTKWKYIFVVFLALGVLDHYFWTQVGLWWWCVVGVATTGTIKSDKIFKTVEVKDV